MSDNFVQQIMAMRSYRDGRVLTPVVVSKALKIGYHEARTTLERMERHGELRAGTEPLQFYPPARPLQHWIHTGRLAGENLVVAPQ